MLVGGLTTNVAAPAWVMPVPGAGVNVLGRKRIGPFDVTRLAAQDPAALTKWLTDTAYQHVIYRERNRGDPTGLALLTVIALGALAFVVALLRRSSRSAS